MIKQILYLVSGLIMIAGIISGIMYVAIKINDWLSDEKLDSQNIGSYIYDSDCTFWNRDSYCLECVFTYQFYYQGYKKKIKKTGEIKAESLYG